MIAKMTHGRGGSQSINPFIFVLYILLLLIKTKKVLKLISIQFGPYIPLWERQFSEARHCLFGLPGHQIICPSEIDEGTRSDRGNRICTLINVIVVRRARNTIWLME